MDDDDGDNLEEGEEGQEEDTTATYSKKKHFGKLDKDLKGWVKWQLTYRPRNDKWKPFSISLENSKATLSHKKQFGSAKSNTKLKFNLKYDTRPRFNELNSKITTKLWGSTLTLNNKISENSLSSKASHSLSLWDRLKVKYGLDFEKKKKEMVFGGSLTLNYKRSFSLIPYLPFLSFVSKYNETFHLGSTLKIGKRPRWDGEYKGHIITRDNHRVFLSHKLTYDPNSKNPSPISQTLTLNAQDGESIATVNSSLHLEKFTIKSKEFRFLIEYDKKYRFGVQKKNEVYEFLMERYKISQKYLKTVKCSVGNKGFITTWEGKFNVAKTSLEYGVNMKWKPGGGNFYNDSSGSLTLKWNI